MPRWDLEVRRNRQEALASGADTYQGSPCKHGHPGLRYVRWNGKCVDCHKAKNLYYENNREAVLARNQERLEKLMWRGAQQRARKLNRPFDIEISDIEIPERCPISGKPLIAGTPDAPSLDRIDNSKGYVKGNVMVISRRMNTAKSDLTAEEARRLADFMTMLS